MRGKLWTLAAGQAVILGMAAMLWPEPRAAIVMGLACFLALVQMAVLAYGLARRMVRRSIDDHGGQDG